MPELPIEDTDRLIARALIEDLGDAPDVDADVTSRLTIDASARGSVAIVAREPGVAAGLPIVWRVAARVDPSIEVMLNVADSEAISPQQRLATLSGPVRSLLAAERTILNFLTHLSGIATLTAQYVDAIAGTRAAVLDTRKTLPGWRRLAKYAVACGGGTNHRMSLHDAVLIKDNHLAAAGAANPDESIADLLRRVRQALPEPLPITIEVDTVEQLAIALRGEPDVILLDNMPPAILREAVAMRDVAAPKVRLEASGGINLATIAAVAQTGVDRISVGAITHSAATLDLGFDWKA